MCFSPPPPIPHGFHGKARHLIAYGEIEDVAHNVGGFADGLDAVDAHRPSAVVFIEVGYAHILLQISQDASECQQLIDCGINLYIQKEQLTSLDEEGHPSLFATIMIATLSTCAQLERDNISFRLQSGRKRYIEKCGKLGRKVGSVKTEEQIIILLILHSFQRKGLCNSGLKAKSTTFAYNNKQQHV